MIKNLQLHVLPEVATKSELLLKIVSDKTNTKKSDIKHIEILKRSKGEELLLLFLFFRFNRRRSALLDVREILEEFEVFE